MTTPVFPSDLPGVSSLRWEPESTTFVSDNEAGPRDYRSFSRVPAARASVSWRFLENDFSVFKAFWNTDLIRGHRWFRLVLPSAAGYATHTVRFIKHHTSRVDGYGYRTVEAELYVRERKLRPDELFTYIMSTLFPITVQDSMDVACTVLSGALGQNFGYADDYLDAVFTLVSGELRVALVQYAYHSSDVDLLDSALTVVGPGSSLMDVLVSYSNYLNETTERLDSVITVLSGTLVAALVQNSMQTEALDINCTVVSGTLA